MKIIFSLNKSRNHVVSLLILGFLSFQAQAQLVRVIDNKGTISNVRNNQVSTALIAPTMPLEGDIWFDTTTAISKVWNGNSWNVVDQDAVTIANTAPTSPVPVEGDIWFNNTDTNNTFANVWNGSLWQPIKNSWLGNKTIYHTSATILGIKEALHNNADIHIENTGDLSITNTDVSDATNFYITNTTAEDRLLSFTGFAGAYLRNGGIITNLSAGLAIKANTRYLAHITQNASNFYFNATEAGGSGDVVPLWKSDTNGGSYLINDIINYNGLLYKNLTGTNTDASPNLDPTNWETYQKESSTQVEVIDIIDSSGSTNWTPRTVAEQNKWFSVVYGNGLYVAVGISGTTRVATSPDGITWTNRTAAEQNNWDSVVYANGLFVAVSTNGTNRVMTSPDGINWTARVASEQNEWFSVTYGNGLFVAVSSTGTNRVMTSPDGITWTAQTASELSSWMSVIYGGGQFVAVAISGANLVMTSPDGINWTSRSAAAVNQWRSITYGNGTYVSVSSSGSNRVMTSPDGITWTAGSAIENNSWYSVTYGNGLFVSIAGNGTTRAMTSVDGIVWTPSVIDSNLWVYVTYGNGYFVAVSFDGANRIATFQVPPMQITNKSYALTNIASIDTWWGSITDLEENDVVTYDGTNWNVTLDVSTQETIGDYKIFNESNLLVYFYNGTEWSSLGGSSVLDGSSEGNTLRWDATSQKWVESTALKNDASNITISGNVFTSSLNSTIGSGSNFFSELYVKNIFDNSSTPSSGTSGQLLSIDDLSGDIKWVDAPSTAMIQDADADTKIQVEETTDEDVIRFDVAGRESLVLTPNALTLKTIGLNPGGNGASSSSFVQGYDALNNVQLALMETADVGVPSATAFRFLLGNNLPSIDGVSGNGAVVRNIGLGSGSGNVGVGYSTATVNNLIDYKLKVASTFYTGGQSILAANGGNVGVGIDNPESLFHVNGGNNAGIRFSDLANSGNNLSLSMYHGGASGKGMSILWNDSVGADGALIFQKLDNTGTFLENLHWFGRDGNVGFGTQTPTERLHVNGNSILSGNTTINGETKILKTSGNVLTVGDGGYQTKYLTLRDGSNYAAKWGLQANNNIGTSGSNLTISSKDIAFKAGVPDATLYENVVDPNLFLKINGDVGIGTNTPTQELDVNGNVRIRQALFDSNNESGTAGQVLSSTITGINWVDAPSTAMIQDADADTKIQVEEGTDDDTIRFDTASIERAIILPNGNVGIGTSTPLSLLSVNGKGSFGDSATASNTTRALNLISSDAVMRIMRISADINTASPGIEIIHRTSVDGANSSYWDFYPSSTGLNFRDRNNGNVTPFVIENATPSNSLYLDSTGNVGLGTTTPTQKLDVNGSAHIDEFIFDENNESGVAGQVLSSTATGIDWVDAASSNLIQDADADTKIQVEEGTDDDTIRFDTAGIERLIITDAGNVGIGTSTSGHKLKVSGSGAAVFLVDKGTEGGFGDGHGSTFNINQGDGTSSGGQRAFTVHGNPTSTIGLVDFYSHNGTGYVLGFHQDNFGNVSIGKENPLTQLDITGDLRTDTFSTDWISGGTYAISDVVVYQGALYRNLLGVNTTTVPNLDVTNWRNLDTPFASVTNELLFDDGSTTGYLYVSLVINNAWQVTRFKKDDPNDEGVATIGNNTGTTTQPTTLALSQGLTYTL